jgi:ketosteroid isomerase-like protein
MRISKLARSIGILAVIAATAVQTTAAAPRDAAATVRDYFDAQNRGDVRAALALVAPDARFEGTSYCGDAACANGSAIQEAIEFEVGDRTQVALVGPLVVHSAERVTGLVEVRSDALSVTVDRIRYYVAAEARDGQLTALRYELDADDQQTSIVMTRLAEVQGRVLSAQGYASAHDPTWLAVP